MFLNDVEPLSADIQFIYLRHFSNWLKIANIIYNSTDQKFVLQILQLELQYKKRPYIIKRLYGRFLAIRAFHDRSSYEFVKTAPLPKEQFSQLKSVFINWTSLAMYLNECYLNEEQLKSYIKYERMHKNRPYILSRLYGRFNRLRKERELKEMEQW